MKHLHSPQKCKNSNIMVSSFKSRGYYVSVIPYWQAKWKKWSKLCDQNTKSDHLYNAYTSATYTCGWVYLYVYSHPPILCTRVYLKAFWRIANSLNSEIQKKPKKGFICKWEHEQNSWKCSRKGYIKSYSQIWKGSSCVLPGICILQASLEAKCLTARK